MMKSIGSSNLSFQEFRLELAKPRNADPWVVALRRASAVGVVTLPGLHTQGQLADQLYRYGGDWSVWM